MARVFREHPSAEGAFYGSDDAEFFDDVGFCRVACVGSEGVLGKEFRELGIEGFVAAALGPLKKHFVEHRLVIGIKDAVDEFQCVVGLILWNLDVVTDGVGKPREGDNHQGQ